MAEHLVQFLVWAMYAYALAGALFSLVFVFSGVQKIDSQTHGAGIGFRLLIFPGVAAFWPLFLSHLLRADHEQPEEGNPHR